MRVANPSSPVVPVGTQREECIPLQLSVSIFFQLPAIYPVCILSSASIARSIQQYKPARSAGDRRKVAKRIISTPTASEFVPHEHSIAIGLLPFELETNVNEK